MRGVGVRHHYARSEIQVRGPAKTRAERVGNYGRKYALARLLSATGRYCRKKILRGSSSNIDSRRASNAQDRFKNPACTILLLRVVRVAPTFSTASVTSRKAHSE